MLVLSKKRIREARAASGESQEAVARRIDVSTSTIRNAEYGPVTPSAEVIARMAELYGVAMESLFEHDSEPATASNGGGEIEGDRTAAATRSPAPARQGG